MHLQDSPTRGPSKGFTQTKTWWGNIDSISVDKFLKTLGHRLTIVLHLDH